ncbi:JAB domain-containing protein [Amphritea balenae]|uniref:RadC-like JAB domain-containing protein n=1 Tax=Amphritea balenae TaxID=452629 RepID=A0A3P1SL97_9GAMM|nr:hypothetical protein EHS89_16905 [Amphritea balenae]
MVFRDALQLLDIRLLDHMVVGDTQVTLSDRTGCDLRIKN